MTSDIVENDLNALWSSLFGSLLMFAIAEYLLEKVAMDCTSHRDVRHLLKYERMDNIKHSQLRRLELLEARSDVRHFLTETGKILTSAAIESEAVGGGSARKQVGFKVDVSNVSNGNNATTPSSYAVPVVEGATKNEVGSGVL